TTACAAVEVPTPTARADTRHPTAIAATPPALCPLTLSLLPAFVVRALPSLRVLLVVARRRADALSAAAHALPEAPAKRQHIRAGEHRAGDHRPLVQTGVERTSIR